MSGYTLSCDYLVATEAAKIGTDIVLSKTGLAIKDGVTITANEVKFANGVGITKDGLVTADGLVSLSGTSVGFADGFHMQKTMISSANGETKIVPSSIKVSGAAGASSLNDYGIVVDDGDTLLNRISITKSNITIKDGLNLYGNNLTSANNISVSSDRLATVLVNVGQTNNTLDPITAVSIGPERTAGTSARTKGAFVSATVTGAVQANADIVGLEGSARLTGTTGNVDANVFALVSTVYASNNTRVFGATKTSHLHIQGFNGSPVGADTYSAMYINDTTARKLDCVLDIESTSGTVVAKTIVPGSLTAKSLKIKHAGTVYYLPLYASVV